MKSSKAGCYYCLSTFDASEVTEFFEVEEKKEKDRGMEM